MHSSAYFILFIPTQKLKKRNQKDVCTYLFVLYLHPNSSQKGFEVEKKTAYGHIIDTVTFLSQCCLGDPLTLPKYSHSILLIYNLWKGSSASLSCGNRNQSLTKMMKCPQWNLQRKKLVPMSISILWEMGEPFYCS